ncbi:hypothetical protein K458DRAFT_392806 [Lentithecium fluviatile CBS 122367]|uniref:CFEM domain-containing protein n=1 Tax=Lentithecium fluviatile CBS 122367 TaxID=1168545 RepID=A0A6G1IQE4_9PLEO|nr:hypothetical protein K458DRAFT_392806 [Lentithecium fluviatile CBS 122367]
MKSILALLAIAALTTAQSISDIPTCALSCLTTSVSAVGCSLTDFECSCKKSAELTTALTPCVTENCDVADQPKVVEALVGICKSQGITVSAPQVTATATAAPTSSAIPTSAPSPPAITTDTDPDDDGETCVPVTVIVTQILTEVPGSNPTPTSVRTTASPVPPYPTGSSKPSGGVPSGTAPSGTGARPTSGTPPEFTGAALKGKVPAGLAGVLGLAAALL